MMDELQRQIIAIQLIQELIVDKLDEANIVSRVQFENELQDRVKQLNERVSALSNEIEQSKQKSPIMFVNTIMGEA